MWTDSSVAKRGWEAFEAEVTEMLGLGRTITSGNKWFDRGDAVSRDHADPFPLYVDAKFTEKISFSLRLRELHDYSRQAAEVGKRLALALRLWPPAAPPSDYVVLSLHDFAELLQLAKQAS
jgi:hypothetical protein